MSCLPCIGHILRTVLRGSPGSERETCYMRFGRTNMGLGWSRRFPFLLAPRAGIEPALTIRGYPFSARCAADYLHAVVDHEKLIHAARADLLLFAAKDGNVPTDERRQFLVELIGTDEIDFHRHPIPFARDVP